MDAISRQTAIDYCEALMNAERLQQTDDWGYGRERYNQTECIMHYIENMPSIQPKKGKWIDTGENEEWYAREYRCSECGDTMLGDANFCPNCGADMREGKADAQPEPNWIPCSERLPEEQGLYLVTELEFERIEIDIRYFNIDGDNKFWSGWGDDPVIAWMPLPEPYKCEE